MLVAVVQMSLTEEGLALRTLTPPAAVTVGHAAEAAVAALDRAGPPFQVAEQVLVLFLADRACAYVIAICVVFAVCRAELAATVDAHTYRRLVATGKQASDLARV
jgi:hypothetical protein